MTPFPEREKDTISKLPERSQSPELPDNKMINEGYKKDPGNFWAWILVVVAISALIWGTLSQYTSYMQEAVGPHPFLHVSNREMSRFLWQNPEFMRANFRIKTGYLPAFTLGNGTRLDPALADEWVVAPPRGAFSLSCVGSVDWRYLVSASHSRRAFHALFARSASLGA